MVRREFLAAMLALGGKVWVDRHAEAAEFVLRPTAGPGLVSWLEEVTREMAGRWDDGHPARLQRQLLGYYTVLAELVDICPLVHRQDLAQIASRNAALLGLMMRVTGEGERSLGYLLAADAFAIEAKDDSLRALIAVWRSDVDSTVQAGLAGPSNHFVRQQLAFAESRESAAPAVRAFVLLRKAEEHAAAGEVAYAYRCLDQAVKADAKVTDRETGLFGISWSTNVVSSFAANIALLCGHPEEAVPTLEAVIPSARSTSNRVAAVTDLASACARLGEVEHAAELLMDALAGARAGGLAERERRIVGVRERDLSQYGGLPAVQRLDEAILAR